MYAQQSDSNPPTSDKQKPGPDLALLAAVWLLTATFGWMVGYWPPEFKPRWLFRGTLGSIFVAWIGVGMLILVFGHDGIVGTVQGAAASLIGLGGLVFIPSNAGSNASRREQP